jgi:hypothetical protein
VLFDLIKQYRRQHGRYAEIARTIHTLGVFLPSNSGAANFDELLRKYGAPSWVAMPGTGKVLLSVDRCKKYAKHIHESSAETIDEESALFNLITTVIVHEHAHAITYEGVSDNGGLDKRSRLKDQIKHSAVSETLAEWAGLDFSKQFGQFSDAILAHAEAGEFPSWPYSGAIIMENVCLSGGTAPYRYLAQLFRKSEGEAFDAVVYWAKKCSI